MGFLRFLGIGRNGRATGAAPIQARHADDLSAHRSLFGEQRAPAPPVVFAVPVPQAAPQIVEIVTPYPDQPDFRAPRDLSVSELQCERALIVGSCLSGILQAYLPVTFAGLQSDHIIYNHAGTLPIAPPQPIEHYDFQIIMLALRTVMPEQLLFRLNYNDVEGYQAAFEDARERLLQMLHGALGYLALRQITTFVTNYAVPQQNLMGRLLPRYDLRNPVYFVEMLNQVIATEISAMQGVHLVDLDQISASYGRKYVQDDVVWLMSHHSIITDYDHGFDQGRLEPPQPISASHPFRAGEFIHAICREIRAMLRTIRQADQVKLVIVDLDDTLWRGVVAEDGLDRPMVTEGWPIGFIEALAYLKKRGVLLAIVSKNDEDRIRSLWPSILGSRFELSDFASVKINWNSKADNVELVLKEMNLLARSVVFIDDNPVERANVAAAFPQIRLLGADPYALRRIMLWAPETQVAYVTDESARRTEMIQAQALRENTRVRLTRAEFLETLEVRIRFFPIRTLDDPRFARAFELINKSNQFNTTGRRWTQAECQVAFGEGGVFWAFEVDDKFTSYGVVGVAIAAPGRIDQFVMSCRVIGMEVEIAVISAVVTEMPGAIQAAFVTTEANFLCKDLYQRCGMTEQDGGWFKPHDLLIACPVHIRALERQHADATA